MARNRNQSSSRPLRGGIFHRSGALAGLVSPDYVSQQNKTRRLIESEAGAALDFERKPPKNRKWPSVQQAAFMGR